MSGVKHTPGPWVWVDRVLQGSAKYAGPHDNGGFVDSNGEMVCWFGDAEHYYPTDGIAPSEADKRLIAAAPDLLETGVELQAARKIQNADPSAKNALRVRHASDAFDAAIARARGES